MERRDATCSCREEAGFRTATPMSRFRDSVWFLFICKTDALGESESTLGEKKTPQKWGYDRGLISFVTPEAIGFLKDHIKLTQPVCDQDEIPCMTVKLMISRYPYMPPRRMLDMKAETGSKAPDRD
ncbi:hypothetical protein JMJ77_0003293 [Colletotrichum scovillei]|uniref:Uncharacterized protein n=1 Tax=Colletotrichum scovillei TaxID=1209932 RepID=A0A9P7QVT6_9PEZI|nr:hypothetical protein JMJ78_0006503 [Colletotrichum scovillei]KAG7043589.1 hypothetical protein JMJ77_0003293 [Colletotrichum scovillei]KAG7063047.1 hypothetical protein JMJ76_0009886 [Colletotrichum scovillei]